MNRLMRALMLFGVPLFSGAFAHAAGAAPNFPQCPAVGADSGCQYLITVSDAGTSITVDGSQNSYASNPHETGLPTDALIGVQNNSSNPLTSLDLNGPIIFEFDGDGLCNSGGGSAPNGCATATGTTSCGISNGTCSFPPPPGEPPNHTEFLAVSGTAAFPNGDVQNGYEGPTSWFSNPGRSPNNSGTVNFSPAVPAGGSTYFSLEAAPTSAIAHLSSSSGGSTPPPPPLRPTARPTHLTVGQTAAGLSGPVIYVPSGVRAQGSVRVTGGSGNPTGIVSFRLFSNSTCSGDVLAGSTKSARAGLIRSGSMLIRRPGTYYWQTVYSGDSVNAAAVTTCGSQLIVVPPVGKVGLPRSKRCVSSVTARLRLGRRAARAAEVFVNGQLVQTLAGNKIHLPVRGRETIAVIVSSVSHGFSRGLITAASFRQQSRTYKAC